MYPTRQRILAARIVAVVADAVQFGFLPVFVEGAASVVNDVLDVAVAAVMIYLVGWHWSFVPAFLAELVPIGNLAPTWTLAVLIATRKGSVADPRAAAGAEPPVARPQPPGHSPF